jgi:hypothetical protein
LIDDTAATVLSGSLARAQFGTLAGEQAGKFAITQGTLAADSNYTMSFTAGTLSITPATLTVAANPETKVYGTSDPTLTNNAAGFVDTTVDGVPIDDAAATVLAGALARAKYGTLAGEQVGGYAITQGTLAANANYAISFTGNTLTITPAALSVTTNQAAKIYGTNDPSLTDTATGFVVTTVDGVSIDDTASSALSGHLARAQSGTLSGEQAGSYAITQGTLAAANYSIAFTGSTLTISPATLTIAANPETKVYGTNDPALTDSATGFVDTTVDGVSIDDTAVTVLTGALARAQFGTLAGEQAGSYAITQGTLAADNDYAINFTGGTLSITPAALTIWADTEAKPYGTTDPEMAYTQTGSSTPTRTGYRLTIPPRPC